MNREVRTTSERRPSDVGIAVGAPSVRRRCPVDVPSVRRRRPVDVPSVRRVRSFARSLVVCCLAHSCAQTRAQTRNSSNAQTKSAPASRLYRPKCKPKAGRMCMSGVSLGNPYEGITRAAGGGVVKKVRCVVKKCNKQVARSRTQRQPARRSILRPSKANQPINTPMVAKHGPVRFSVCLS